MSDALSLGLQHTFAEALDGLYLPWTPQGFPAPRLVQLNDALYRELGLPEEARPHAAELFSGSRLPSDARPLAQAYAGHQFGGFSRQLGDGRAVLLGEIVDRAGRRRDLQLKGSGPTPFSRGGDGKATLGPVLREYLVGEAMHHLGVPTTRVLAALATGEQVVRGSALPGAVLARVAASHLRVGTLEFFAARGEVDRLGRLVDYALERHYPEQRGADAPAAALLEAVAVAQARLVARWMQIGFVHGVMNTDNVALSGETIDYGPCAFMEAYDPATVFSSIDHHGRYAFGNQPSIALWNLDRMGDALRPLLGEAAEVALERARDRFAATFNAAMLDGLRAKLGLAGAHDGDADLIGDLLAWMHETGQDHTLTYRRLARALRTGASPRPGDGRLDAWLARWRTRLGDERPADVAARMDRVNPLYIPRNHLVEGALDAAIAGDMGPFRELLRVLSTPCAEQPGREAFTEPAPPDAPPYQTFCGT